jgi:serine/threonine protein kinase
MGGFGITYRAEDKDLHELVAIKEYLPSDLAQRQGDSTVTARSKFFEKDFEWGLNRFLDEAITLAKFRHNHIVRVKQYFKQNGTAYLVMEYEDGPSLEDVLNRSTSLSEAETKRILYPILDGLKKVHEQAYLHRDIKPSNIIVRDNNGGPVLIDFGAARQAIGPKTQAITAILTPGYAPLEQYSPDDNQGPWTDIYALGAVAYRCLTGEKPPYATMRVRKDPLVPISVAAKSPVSPEFAHAIEWALRLEETARPKTIDEFIAAMSSGAQAPAPAASDETKLRAKADKPKKPRKQKEKTGSPSEDSKKVAKRGRGTTESPAPVSTVPPPAPEAETRLIPRSAASIDVTPVVSPPQVAVPDPVASSATPEAPLSDATIVSLATAVPPAETAPASPFAVPPPHDATVVSTRLPASTAAAPAADESLAPLAAATAAASPVEAPALSPAEPAPKASRGHSTSARPNAAPIGPAPTASAPRKSPKPLYLAGGAAAALLLLAILIGVSWPTSTPTPTRAPSPTAGTPSGDRQGLDQALQFNSIPALEGFLNAYSASPYAAEARERIAAIQQEVEQAWNSAVTTDTVAGYDAFLTQYGANNLRVTEAQEARERIRPEDTEWQGVVEQQTVSAYQQYLYMFPTGKHQAEAVSELSARWPQLEAAEDRAGRAAIAASTVFACREYLRNYPDGRHIEACQTKVDGLAPLLVDYQRKLITIGAYRGAVVSRLTDELIASVTAFQSKSGLTQNGIFDTPTTTAIDRAVAELDTAYGQAKEKRTRRDYEAFLQAYPSSTYTQDVRSRISQCRVESRTGAAALSRIQHQERIDNDVNACVTANAKAQDGARAACTTRGGRTASVRVLKSEEVARPILGGIFGMRACVATAEAQCEIPGGQTQVDVCP